LSVEENIRLLESGESLTDVDKDVIDIIRKTCAKTEKNVVVRIAGGWVRDKLMGISSDDIDITISGISSIEFGKLMSEMQKSKIVVLEANHEQSKHIDTARVCLFKNFWLDICNLRADDYSSGKSAEGTPESDARRRDFSMNAIFFNINEMKVEDFVSGIQSIKDKVIRTPISPEEDFSDDPLRIIRCFRFMSKLGFKVDPQIRAAIPKMIPLFLTKITKDRIATELVKLFQGKEYFTSLKTLIETGMLRPVFDPENDCNLDEEVIMKRIERVHKIDGNISTENAMIIYFAAIYADLFEKELRSDTKKRNRPTSAIDHMIVRTMRLTTDLSHNVTLLLKGRKLINEMRCTINRVSAGRFVRSVGKTWTLVRPLIEDDETLSFYDTKLLGFIQEEKLEEAYNLKQLVDGKTLAEMHGIKPGPQLRNIIEQLIDWQLENPNGTIEEYKLTIKKQSND
jgi:tRNA nucleotidyltransferase (CCA-adding enzyme)